MIKYCAMAFAIFLSVVIFGSIIAAVTGVAAGVAGVTYLTEEEDRVDLFEQYTEQDIAELGIKSVLVDCNAHITVQRGEVLSVEATDVTEEYKIQCSNGRLSVVQEEKNVVFKVNWVLGEWNTGVQERVVVTIPESFVSERIEIHSGSGKVYVTDAVTECLELDSGFGSVEMTNVTTETLRVDSGSGKMTLSGVNAKESVFDTGSGSVKGEAVFLGKLRIVSGSGAVRLTDLTANDVTVDSGSGSVDFSGKITGDCKFETGSGSVSVAIDGAEEDYLVEAECGSGSFRINGKKKDEGSYGKNVKGSLFFDAGSGSVDVMFNTPTEE